MKPALYLVGATASGKKQVALQVAASLPVDLLALDAMKVFRGLDRGTAKTPGGRFGLTDLVEPDAHFSVGDYAARAREACAQVWARGRLPLFVGGTGLYLRALVRGLFEGPPVGAAVRAAVRRRLAEEGPERLHTALTGLDPEAAARIHPHDGKRLARALEVREATGRTLSSWQREHTRPALAARHLLVGLHWPDDLLRERIRVRVESMLEAGLVDEVERLRAAGRLGGLARMAIGYREVLALLEGRTTPAACRDDILRATWKLARRQAAWFRQFPQIRWVEARAATPLAARVVECFRELLPE